MLCPHFSAALGSLVEDFRQFLVDISNMAFSELLREAMNLAKNYQNPQFDPPIEDFDMAFFINKESLISTSEK
jgi:hypothetical protein